MARNLNIAMQPVPPTSAGDFEMDFRSNEADRITRDRAGGRRSFSHSLCLATGRQPELDMDYVRPADPVIAMIDVGQRKLALPPRDLMIRGILAGALLGAATTLVIPTGMLFGAKAGFYDWWVWNQIPVTLGNMVGGFVCTGLALYSTDKPRGPLVAAAQPVAQAAA